MRRIAAIFFTIILLMSGLVFLNGSNEEADGKLLNDGILTVKSPIYIENNSNFTSANGVSSGSGTEPDPYIIENWKINASSGNAITIIDTGSHFIIRNCWVVDGNYKGTGNWYNGIRLNYVTNGSIENCLLDSNGDGIVGIGLMNFTIFNNTFIGNNHGMNILYQSQEITITNNSLSHNSVGIRLSSGISNCVVANNTINRSYRTGINLDLCHGNNVIEYNTCTNTYLDQTAHEDKPRGNGIKIEDCSNTIVRYNNCSGNSNAGISLVMSDENLILGNTLMDNRWAGDGFSRYGLFIGLSDKNTFRDNQMKDCGIALVTESAKLSKTNSIDQTNSVNGKSVLYLKNSTTPETLDGEYGSIILLNCRNKSIEDLNIDGIPFYINIQHSLDIEIEFNNFKNTYEGIFITDSNDIGFHGNSFEDFGYAIEIIDSSFLSICNNSFINGTTGVLSELDHSEVSDNNFIGVDNGIRVTGTYNLIKRNSVSGGDLGIRVNSQNSTIINNTIDSCKEIGMRVRIENSTVLRNHIFGNNIGIQLDERSSATIEENMIIANEIGIISESLTGLLEIKYNNISNNEGYGIDLYPNEKPDPLKGAGIFLNVFYNNNKGGVQARQNGIAGGWDVNHRGNYWNDYEKRYVPPAKNNGIYWFTRYDLDGGSLAEDFYPLVHPPINITPPSNTIRISRADLTSIPTFIEYSEEFNIVYYSGDRQENISWRFSTNADWLTFDSERVLKGRPMSEDVGSWWVNISVTDGDLSDIINFTMEVYFKNYPPKITTPDVTSVDQWQKYHVDYNATDFESELKWRLVANASFLSLDNDTGVLSGIPGLNDVGMFFINVSVTDGEIGDYHYFYLNVTDVNDPPMQNSSKPYFTMLEDNTISYPINDLFFNYDNDPMEITLTETTAINATIDENDILQISPDANWFGTGWMNFSASDGYYNKTFSVNVIVLSVNDAPSNLNISIPGATLTVGGDQIVTAGYYDPDIGDEMNITWYIDGVVVSYNSSYNLSLPAGSYNLTLRVTDSTGNYTEITTPITVESVQTDGNDPPGPDYIWTIILAVSFLALTLIGALIFILRRRSHPSGGAEEMMNIPSSPVSQRRPGEVGERIGPSLEFKLTGVNGGALDSEASDLASEDIPWALEFRGDLGDIMMEALDDEELYFTAGDIAGVITTLKRKQRDGELTEEDYRKLRGALDKIKEE